MNKNIKILIVNNNKNSSECETITAALNNINLQNIETTDSIKDAIQLAVDANTATPFDVSFLHELNVEDEIQLIKSLLEINPQQYVVVLTDNISPDKILNCIRAGASGVLNKPYTADKLRLELDKFSFLREDKKIVAS